MKIAITKRRVSALIAGGVVLLVLTTAGSCDSGSKSSAQSSTQKQTENAFKQQSAAVPYPASQLNNSLERANLRERLLRYNNPSKISYVYLLSQTGGIYAYFTIKGKVTSNSSQMTTTDLIVQDQGSGGGGNVTVPAPGDDGSYGPSEDGVFFFTTDNVLIQWDGLYLLSDAPLKINPAGVTLNYMPGSKPTSTGGK